MRAFSFSAPILFSLVCCLVSANASAAGPIDPSFGYGGRPFIYFDYIGTPSVEVKALATDFEGHVISAGRNDSNGSFLVTRFNLETPVNFDSAFGSGGLSVNPYGSADSGAVALAIDHHDRIVTAGYEALYRSCGSESVYTYYFSAARIKNGGGTDDGEMDASFGSGPLGGVTGVSVGDCRLTSPPTAIAIGQHDEVTLGGSAFDGSHNGIALVRWDASGVLDASFGSGGVVNPTTFASIDIGLGAIAIDDEDRTLVAAFEAGPGASKFYVYRFNKDGTRDVGFGLSGAAVIDWGAYTNACCIAIDSAKRIIVAGSFAAIGFVARFTQNGTLDATFGTAGVAAVPLSGDSSATGLSIDHEGRAIVVGRSDYGLATLTHLNADGTVNRAVGYGGVYTTPLGFSTSVITSVVVDQMARPNVSIVASDVGGGRNISAAVRYDEMFGDGFD